MLFRRRRKLMPLEDRGPLRVMFVNTCMPVGGAETLLVEVDPPAGPRAVLCPSCAA